MFVWARGVSVPLGSWTQVKHTALSISTIWQRLKRKQSGSGQEYSFLTGILFLFISNGPSGLQHQTAHYLASFAHIEPILSDLSQILHTAQSSYRRQVRPEIYKMTETWALNSQNFQQDAGTTTDQLPTYMLFIWVLLRIILPLDYPRLTTDNLVCDC